jgi:ABC-type glycerol-3-phosphate transport system substrate-binding protein
MEDERAAASEVTGISRRSLLKRGAALGLSVSAAGVADALGSATAQAMTARKAAKKVDITFLKGPWVPNEPAFVQKNAVPFYKANPGIHVTEIEYQWATRDEDLTRAFSGTVPDTTYFSEMYWAKYAALGALLPLDDLIKDSDFESTYKAIPAAQWEQMKYKGKTYAVPFVVALGSSNLANVEILKQAGVTDWSSSITALRAAAKQIKEKTGIWGYAMPTVYADNSWGNVAGYILAGGTSIYNSTYTKAALNTPDFVTVLDTLKEMYLTDKSAPAAGLYEQQGMDALFAAGKLGIYNTYSVNPTMLPAANKFKLANFAVAALPGVGGGKGSYLGSGQLTISAESKNQEAAWAWIKYLSSKQGLLPWLNALDFQFLGARTDMTVNLYPKNNAIEQFEAESYRDLVATGIAKFYPPEPHLSAAQLVLSNQFETMLSGSQTAAQTAANMESQINTILATPVGG